MTLCARHSIVPAFALTVVALFLALAMAGRAESAPEPEKAKPAVIQFISATGEADATELVIRLSAHSVYTSYKTAVPLRLVIDLSQTVPGVMTTPVAINRGNIKNVSVSSFDSDAGTLSRISIDLVNDVEATITVSPENPAELHIAFPVQRTTLSGATPEATSAAQSKAALKPVEPAAVSAPPPTKGAVNAGPTARPVPEGGVKGSLSGITATEGDIIIAVNGGVDAFKAFRLANPERYVIDLPGVVSILPGRLIPLNVSGVTSARIGSYHEKVRVVLDGVNGRFPEVSAVKSAEGLRILFAGKSRRVVAATAASAGAEVTVPVQDVDGAVQKTTEPVQKAEEPSRKAEEPSLKAGEPEQKSPEQKIRKIETLLQPQTSVVKPPSREQALTAGVPVSVEMIDFQVIDTISRVSIKISGGAVIEPPVKQGGDVTLTIPNASLPKRLQHSLETEAFTSPVLRVTPYMVKTRKGNDTRVRIALRSATPFEFRHEGDMYFVDFKANEGLFAEKSAMETLESRVHPAQAAKGAEARDEDISSELTSAADASAAPSVAAKMYKGRKVTLEFADADVRKIFQLLSEVSNRNFVLGDDVTGTISIKLVNVPWDQALDIILDTKGLDKREQGNVIVIKAKGKFKTQAEEEQEIKKTLTNSTELKTETFSLNYADVTTISTQFKALKTDRGIITLDARTNKVIVKDVPSALDDMHKLVQQLDIPEKQVMIEARIVEATSSFSQSIGINWGIHYQNGSAPFLGINSLDTNFGGAVTTIPTTSGVGGTAAGMATGISFGSLTSNIQLDMRLNAAATVGLVKIISAPKVATLNNKTAKISSGQQIPYQNSSANTGPVTQFVEAALALEVTPHVNANGTISLKIDAKNDAPGSVPVGATAPAINKKEAQTEMLLQDGETTVIGGIYVDNASDEDDGVPFLMDIPFIGKFFKDTTKTDTKTELLIFITPKILSSF